MKTSRILNEVHESVAGLHKSGLVDKKTMREFDILCLKNICELKPEDIKQIRENEHVSQSLFAAYLNTSVSAIRKWESGEKKPSGMALRLLNLIQKKGLDIII